MHFALGDAEGISAIFFKLLFIVSVGLLIRVGAADANKCGIAIPKYGILAFPSAFLHVFLALSLQTSTAPTEVRSHSHTLAAPLPPPPPPPGSTSRSTTSAPWMSTHAATCYSCVVWLRSRPPPRRQCHRASPCMTPPGTGSRGEAGGGGLWEGLRQWLG